MHGDFTRFTFDRTKRYKGVLKQQGRVDLDADWNEEGDILEYLDQTTRIDVIGKVGVPIHSPGFEVTFVSPNLVISAGRIYVDGILVEQDAPLLIPAAPVPGQKDLVYLDVWERHITAIEDPEIREVALGGPDTCTRVRTEFQVRIAPNIAALDCKTAPLPGPSTGRMTAVVIPAPPSDDPCLIAPSGGYRGLENRFYRVEIHQPGPLGTATFKWSRDNGSITFAITEFPVGLPDRVRVSRLGRDQVLTFRRGDWVEVLNDDNDLNGTPGTLARILDIDEAKLEVQLSVNPPPSPLTKHPKVRRWDQPSTAIVTAAGPLAIEDGIQVSFSGLGAATDFRTGDYWVFAARTAAANSTGDIEGFTNAPAFGIIHHYAALATVLWQPGGAPPIIEICPPKFPPLTELDDDCCCCTVTAGVGGDFPTIQAAIAGAPPGGFVIVCLRPGNFTLTTPVLINRANILITGCSERTVVTAPGGGPAFIAQQFNNVAIESMRIQGSGVWAIWSAAGGFKVRDCEIASGGIWIADGSGEVLIADNRMRKGDGPGIQLRHLPPGMTAPAAPDIEQVAILRNTITGYAHSGILSLPDGKGSLFGLEVAHNHISQCAIGAPPAGMDAAGGMACWAIAEPHIHHNRIERCGGDRGTCGIALWLCAGVNISHNAILNNGIANRGLTPNTTYQAGVFVSFVLGTAEGFAALRVIDNNIQTPGGQSLLVNAIGSVAIQGNRLHSQSAYLQPNQTIFLGMSLWVVTLGNPETQPDLDFRVLFQGNQVFSRLEAVPAGVISSFCLVSSPDDTSVADNQFTAPRLGNVPIPIHLFLGVSFDPKFPSRTARIADNRVTGIRGMASIFSLAASSIITGNHSGGQIFPSATGGLHIVENNRELI